MPRDPFAIPKLSKLPSLGGRKKSDYAGQERRRKKRISVEELNRVGVDVLDLKPEDLEGKDRRSALTKVLDVLDLPRNLIGNLAGSLAGVDKTKLRKGALGLPSVTGSDILAKLGVKDNVAKAILGFVGDVALDPLTYAGLGASTGLSIGKHLPKVLKGGKRVFEAGAKAALAGDKSAAALGRLASAVGQTPQRLTRLAQAAAKTTRARQTLRPMSGAKGAMKYLTGKRGGKLYRMVADAAMTPSKAAGARGFLRRFGEKGRTVLRAPFAESGLTLPWGKRAAVYKAMAPGADETLKTIGGLTKTLAKGRATGARIGTAREIGKRLADAKKAGGTFVPSTEWQEVVKGVAIPPGAEIRMELGGKNFARWAAGQVPKPFKIGGDAQEIARLQSLYDRAKAALGGAKASKKAQKAAEAAAETAGRGIKLAKTSPEASMPFRMLTEQQIGKVYKSTEQLAVDGAGGLRRLYHGIGRAKQQLFGHGQSELGRIFAGIKQKQTAGRYVAEGATGRQMTELLKPIADDVAKQTGQSAEDVSRAMYNLATLSPNQWPDDPIHAALKTGLAQGIKARPDFQAALPKIRQFISESREGLIRRGAKIGEQENYLARPLTEEFAKGEAATSRRVANVFTEQRAKMARFKDLKTGKITDIRTLPAKGSERAKQLRKLHSLTGGKNPTYRKLGEFDISSEFYNTPGPEGAIPGQALTGQIKQVSQFKQDIPEAVAATAGKAVSQHAVLDIRDQLLPWAVRANEEELRKLPELAGYMHSRDAFRGMEKSAAYEMFGKEMIANDVAIPVSVANQLREIVRVTSSPTELNAILRVIDKPMSLWKSVTLMHPGYTNRNIVNNGVQLGLHGINPVPSAIAAWPGSKMFRTMWAAMEGGDLARFGYLGGGMNAPQAVDLARQHNVMGAGLTRHLIGDTMFQKAKGVFRSAGRNWFKFNAAEEDGMRMAAWLHLMDQGMDARQAALKVVSAMPDLSDLTMFERDVMRRIFPWYSWLRKNGSNILKLAARNPAVLVGADRARQAIETAAVGDEKIEEQLRPDWMAEQQAMQILGDRDKGTVFLLANWMPFQDVMDLFEAAQTPDEFFRSMLSKIRPDAKFMIEAGAGQDIFKRRPIEPFTTTELLSGMPAALVGRSGTPLDSLMAIRPLREAVRTAKDMPSTGEKIGRAFIGGALQPLTRQRALSMRYVTIKDELDEVRNAINRANAVSDNAEVARQTKRWFRLSAELERLELPGVAKKTKGTLRRLGVKAGA